MKATTLSRSRARARVWAAAVALAAMAVLAPAPQAGAAPASFVFTGSGWGHGVGLPQFGALEQARDGRNWQQILGHYYHGTSIGGNDVPASVRVLLAGAVPQVTVEAASRFSFTSGGREVAASAGGDGRWTVRVQPSGHFTIYRPNGVPAAAPQNAANPLKVNYDPWSTVVRINETGQRYRWGKIELAVTGNQIRMILDIPLERYVRGIAEVPASWPMEALRAQAVAARTYASDKARRAGHHRSGCDCTLYGDTRDQVYRGYEKEDPAQSANARWVSAVDSTAGKVVTYSSHPIQAYFHSSSGGRTEASADVWSEDLPYLRPVDDPWSMRSSNPYAKWQARLSQEEVAQRLGFRRVDTIEVKSKTGGGGVREAVVRGDTTKTYRGSELRSRLGLRSIKFSTAPSQEAFWDPWRRVNSGDRAGGNPALASSPNGILHALVTSPSEVPYAATHDSRTGRWSPWSRVGPSSSRGTEPDITVDPSGAAQAILRGGSGAIYTARREPGGDWSGWVRIGSRGSRGREPAISAGPDGVMWAVIRGHGSPDIWAARRGATGGWSGWTKVGSDGFEPDVVGTPGGAVVVARGRNEAIKSATYDGGWRGWSGVSGGRGRHPAIAASGHSLVLVVRGRSSDHLYSATGRGSWSGWSRVASGQVAENAAPEVLVDSGGHSHLFVRGAGDVIWTATRGSGAWAGFFQIGAGGDRAASGSDIAAAAVRGRIYTLIRGRSAGLYWSFRTF